VRIGTKNDLKIESSTAVILNLFSITPPKVIFLLAHAPFTVAKLTGGQGGRPHPLAGHFEVFGPPVTTLLILLSDL